jgi:hypothetical protein
MKLFWLSIGVTAVYGVWRIEGPPPLIGMPIIVLLFFILLAEGMDEWTRK